jgi:predicted ferric reductase
LNRTDGRRTYLWRAALGIALYLLLALAPLSLMLLAPLQPLREPLREFAVALAFGAAGILGMQFALSARLRRLKAPYGIDAVFYFHRRMALVALALVIAHPLLLFVVTPERVALLNVLTAPWPARYAVVAVVTIATLVALSVWRARFHISYENWRFFHGIFAVVVLVLVSLHVSGTGIYTVDWKLPAFLIYPAIWAGFFVYARVGNPLRKLRHPYRVAAVRQETPDVWTLSLRPEGHPGITFRPGQFLWITLGRSPFSLEEHPFSFSSSPLAGDGGFDITVKELGDFTASIGQHQPGTVAYVEGPFGAFTTDRYPASRYVFLAGGIGITPVMSILRAAAGSGDRTPMILVYGAKTRDDLAFAAELDDLSEQLDLAITYVLEEPPEEWEGATGFITREVLEAAIERPDEHDYFTCGPPAMTDAVERVLMEMEVDRKRLHYERFEFV